MAESDPCSQAVAAIIETERGSEGRRQAIRNAARDFVMENPDHAVELASVTFPSRNDFAKAKIAGGWSAADRAQFVQELRRLVQSHAHMNDLFIERLTWALANLATQAASLESAPSLGAWRLLLFLRANGAFRMSDHFLPNFVTALMFLVEELPEEGRKRLLEILNPALLHCLETREALHAD